MDRRLTCRFSILPSCTQTCLLAEACSQGRTAFSKQWMKQSEMLHTACDMSAYDRSLSYLTRNTTWYNKYNSCRCLTCTSDDCICAIIAALMQGTWRHLVECKCHVSPICISAYMCMCADTQCWHRSYLEPCYSSPPYYADHMTGFIAVAQTCPGCTPGKFLHTCFMSIAIKQKACCMP